MIKITLIHTSTTLMGINQTLMFFTAELKKLQGNFSIIGICDTNVNSDQKDLYCLQEHNSFYSDKLEGKKSGTGIALYVHDQFNAIKNIVASTTQPHLECIFLKITKGKLNINVGVVYRPPNSNFNDFLSELRGIIKTLPKTVNYLMGDFNLDLHKSELKC